jgi:peptide/nickel transport system permease protein
VSVVAVPSGSYPRIRARGAVVPGVVGAGLFILTVGVAVFGRFVAPYSPVAIVAKPRLRPSADHWLGTDQLGRDLLSRVLHGGLDVIIVPALATVTAFIIGAAIGMWTGYVGGRSERVSTRAVDVLISLPPLLMAIVFISAFGASTAVLVIVTAIFFVPRIVRVVRGATASVVTTDYVAAARARGDSTREVVTRELMPNLSGQLIVEFAARLANVIIFMATLNFLGLGASPPSSSWGLMVAENTLLMRSNPWAPLVPALLTAALAVSVNLLSDVLAQRLARDIHRTSAA